MPWIKACGGPTRPSPTDGYVLLVDDHPPSLERLRRIVEGQGYACATAVGADEAMARCGEAPPWLVVTDLNMPRIDGRGLADWVVRACPGTKVVLLTGECLDPDALTTLRALFVAILTKPLDVSAFLGLLSDLAACG